jgi:hypothetical protein
VGRLKVRKVGRWISGWYGTGPTRRGTSVGNGPVGRQVGGGQRTRCLGAVTETCRFVCGNRYDISALRYKAGRGPADVMCSLLLRGVSSGGSVVSLRVPPLKSALSEERPPPGRTTNQTCGCGRSICEVTMTALVNLVNDETQPKSAGTAALRRAETTRRKDLRSRPSI